MAAPLTIEQLIANHNIGVNISDAETLDGHPIDDFSLKGHKHSASDIESGIMSPARLPTGTTAAKGIVQLNSSADSESQDTAATPYAVKSVKNMIAGKANTVHKHVPEDLNTGTFSVPITANSNKEYTRRQIRNVILSTATPTSTVGQDGDLYFKYE